MGIRFLPEKAVIDMHDRLIAMYGGASGILNKNQLDAALQQPKLEYHLLESNVFELAASYGYHICQNHSFMDGNKRTARMVMVLFLSINGYKLIASEDESLEKMLDITNRKLNKYELSQWLEMSSKVIR